MTKIRVHELAREVGRENKDIIDYLTGKGYDARTAVSAVPDNEVENIRIKFGAAVKQDAQEKKAAAPAENAEKKESDPKREKQASNKQEGKKHGLIYSVFRSQNASGQLQKRPKNSPVQENPKRPGIFSSDRQRTVSDDQEIKPLVPEENPKEVKAAEAFKKENAGSAAEAVRGEVRPTAAVNPPEAKPAAEKHEEAKPEKLKPAETENESKGTAEVRHPKAGQDEAPVSKEQSEDKKAAESKVPVRAAEQKSAEEKTVSEKSDEVKKAASEAAGKPSASKLTSSVSEEASEKSLQQNAVHEKAVPETAPVTEHTAAVRDHIQSQTQNQSQTQDQSQMQNQSQTQGQSQMQNQSQTQGQSHNPVQNQNQNPSQNQTPVQGQNQTPVQSQNQTPVQSQNQTPVQGQTSVQNQRPNQSQGQNQTQGQNRPSYSQGQNRSSYGQNQNRPSYGQGQNRPSYGQGQNQNRPSYGQGQNRPSYGQGQSRPSYGQGQGQGRPSYGQGQGQSRPSYGQGQSRPSYGQGQGQGRPSYGQGQNRPSYGQGQSRPSYGQGQGRPSYGQGQGRPSYGQGQGRPSYGQGQSHPSYGQGQSRPSYGQGQSRPPYGQGGRPQGAARPQETDGALAHKTTRDFRKEGKEYEKTREERRELGRHSQFGNRPNQSQKQFSRIPKALQNSQPKNEPAVKKEVVTEIKIPERMTIRELAEKMKIQPSAVVKNLFLKGEMVTVNHEVTFDKAQEIAMDYDIIAEQEEKEDVIGELLAEDKEDEKDLVQRPPVVCVMGHVDHGKTSLLDAIRNTHVTDREAGGITQHIGAYMVSIKGQKITFLDTPGHEAFTAMRMRGANSTDIAVLVVAADDGVMPQTVEAINHAKAAKVDIIVAVNKIDKPNANIERVKQELSEYGLVPEDWGGQTIFCPVSARTHEGLDNLLEMILLTSEVDELKANPNRKARGLVLEAKLDRGKGPVATILIQKGTLHQGDFIACGAANGKVRAMTDEKGKRLHKATPSMPVEIIGLNAVPDAGEVLVALDSDKEAKDFAATFVSEGKKNLIEETKTQMSLDDLFEQIKEGTLKELPIVVKADVQGSVEAVTQSLLKLSNEEVVVKVIHGGVGAINESDVSLAAASNAIIIGFNVRPDATAKAMADTQKVDIHLYNVIYEAIGDVEKALKGMRAAVYEEKVQGHAEIRQMFKASGVGNIAGAYVKDGIFQRSSKVRVFRGEEKIYEGTLASLKRFKDDVKEVKEGFECGFVFNDWGDFAVEDTVEAYTMVEVPRE